MSRSQKQAISMIYQNHSSEIMITLRIKYQTQHLINAHFLMIELTIMYQQDNNNHNKATEIKDMFLQGFKQNRIKKESKRWNRLRILNKICSACNLTRKNYKGSLTEYQRMRRLLLKGEEKRNQTETLRQLIRILVILRIN